MRLRYLLLLLFIVLIISPSYAFSVSKEDKNLYNSVSIDTAFAAWFTTDLSMGYQLLPTATVSRDTGRYGLYVTGGYKQTRYQKSILADDLNFSSASDTYLGGYYGHDIGPVRVTAGVDLSINTGKSMYSATEYHSMSRDPLYASLTVVDELSQGIVISPNLSVYYRPFDFWTVGIGSRYDWKLKYDPTSDFDNDDVDPGDHIILTLVNVFNLTDSNEIAFSFTYGTYLRDERNGIEIYKNGDHFDFLLSYVYDAKSFFVLRSRVFYRTVLKGEEINDINQLVAEDKKIANDIFSFDIAPSLRLTDRVDFTLGAGIIWVMSNDRPELPSGQDVGEFNLYSYKDAGHIALYVKPEVTIELFRNFYSTLAVGYYYMIDRKDAVSYDNTIYHRATVELGLEYKF